MTQSQLAAVLFAVLGVFIALGALTEFVAYLALLAQLEPAADPPEWPVSYEAQAWISVIGAGLAMAIGAGLVLGRKALSSRLFSSDAALAGEQPIQAVAFSVLGCYFAIRGLSALVAGAFPGQWLDWSEGLQAALGIALFFGAKRLSRFWDRTGPA